MHSIIWISHKDHMQRRSALLQSLHMPYALAILGNTYTYSDFSLKEGFLPSSLPILWGGNRSGID